MFSRLWTSVLFFRFVLDALLRLELLRFDVVEQMNKKVDLSCLKKTFGIRCRVDRRYRYRRKSLYTGIVGGTVKLSL